MRFIRKWYILLILVFLAEVGFDSCTKRGMQQRRFKRMIKKRRGVVMKHRYRSPYQRQFKRKSVPINSNYVIKNKRNYRNRSWY